MLQQAPMRKPKNSTPVSIVEQVIAERGIKDTTVQVQLPPEKSPALKVLLNADKRTLKQAIRSYFESGETVLSITGLNNEKRMAIKNSCEHLVKSGYLVKLSNSKGHFTVGYKRTGQAWLEKEVKVKVKKLKQSEILANEFLIKLEEKGSFVRSDFQINDTEFYAALKIIERKLKDKGKLLNRERFATGNAGGKAIKYCVVAEK